MDNQAKHDKLLPLPDVCLNCLLHLDSYLPIADDGKPTLIQPPAVHHRRRVRNIFPDRDNLELLHLDD